MIQRQIAVAVIISLGGVFARPLAAATSNPDHGPALARFQLTLEEGVRTEAAGPFYYSETKGQEHNWGFIPFYSHYVDPSVEYSEKEILYPLFSDIHYGKEHRWQFGQLYSIALGGEPDDSTTRRVTVFPFYFKQRAADTNLNYTAYMPFYGRLKDRLFHDEMYFVMFPFYAETRKRDVVIKNYMYPFVDVRHGAGMHGWQVWPIIGREHKDVTTQTNGFGEASMVGGHDRSFFIWPFYLKQDNGVGTDNPEKNRTSFPFYSYSRSPLRDATSALLIFNWIDDRGKKYHEWQGPWPFVIFTRGEGKTTSRVWPVFSQSHDASQESDSYLWPAYVYRSTHSADLDFRRTRIGFYLYVSVVEKNLATGGERRRLDMWPFFTWHRDFNGNERLQILAPVEPAIPDQRGIVRNWSPFWSFWRAEKNAHTGATSRSLLWNFYRCETRPGYKKVSLCFGLFGYESGGESKPATPDSSPGPAVNTH